MIAEKHTLFFLFFPLTCCKGWVSRCSSIFESVGELLNIQDIPC